MPNQKETADIAIYPLTYIRTCRVKGEPDTVILELSSGSDVRHYSLALSDLAGLAQRLAQDASVLNAMIPVRFT